MSNSIDCPHCAKLQVRIGPFGDTVSLGSLIHDCPVCHGTGKVSKAATAYVMLRMAIANSIDGPVMDKKTGKVALTVADQVDLEFEFQVRNIKRLGLVPKSRLSPVG